MEPYAFDSGVRSDFKSSFVFECSDNIGYVCRGLHISLHWFAFCCISTCILFIRMVLFCVLVAHVSDIVGHLLLCLLYLLYVTLFPRSYYLVCIM
jgi:hypothetical protein